MMGNYAYPHSTATAVLRQWVADTQDMLLDDERLHFMREEDFLQAHREMESVRATIEHLEQEMDKVYLQTLRREEVE